MANADTPFGLRPVADLSGAPYNGTTVRCAILAADGTATFVGDLVKLSGTAATDTTGDGGTYPSVQQGAASDTAFFGVITSFEPLRTNLETLHRVASTLRYCNVVPATQGQLFEIQCDGAFAITDIGNTADIVVGSGSTTTGLSAMELDSSDIGTGANLQIVGFANRPDNAVDTNANVIVRVNEHTFGGDGTGV